MNITIDPKSEPKLDYLKMLQDINALVESDWAFNMECNLLPNAKPFTQEEAKEMIDIIGKVYLIAHSTECASCQTKYILPQ